MNLLEQYRELIRFHVLTSNEDLTGMTHAAVDEDGGIFVYNKKPLTNDEVGKLSNNDFWVCDESDTTVIAKYVSVGKMEIPEELSMCKLIIKL